MNTALRQDADTIIASSLKAVLPDAAVRRALESEAFHPQDGRILLVAVGKAAWQMAHTAVAALGRVDEGIVITKYGHVRGTIPGVTCDEAGHPVPDENSFVATEKALTMVQNLTDQDTVLFLLSGGGSALFEKPLIPGAELQELTNRMLADGADIVEMNTIRKRLSAVKGGRFALACAPAKIFSIVLSDILGDPLDMIASGPAVPDSSTGEQAIAIARKYQLPLSKEALACLTQETPKALNNVTTQITGSVRELSKAAADACRTLGYTPVLLTDHLCCEAREAGSFLGSIARTHAGRGRSLLLLPAVRPSFISPATDRADVIRSLPWLQRRNYPGCQAAVYFPSAVMALTDPLMPQAAMRTVTPVLLLLRMVWMSSLFYRIIMPIPH